MEVPRKLVHVAFGTLLIAIGAWYGEAALVAFLAFSFFAGLAIIGLWMLGYQPEFVALLFAALERRHADFPGEGALFFVTGALLLATFSTNFAFTLAVIAILSFGDGLATLAGIAGSHALPYNKEKTWEGSIAFFAAGAAFASLFIPLQAALFYAALLAAVESCDFPADDNLVIPAAALVFQLAFGL
ncbi:hypothetical protein COX86_00860 [Candidatus Micrarchaeota archaeon CG_4_10_14_0_2_um_filter_60_11]|nr:MAG: hypothetical protein COU39_03115 [Candidatus Micrarchaeota archaeon CG10_big_fil_rev_8_21_14_0_10_60_32]PIO02174.1 MAG: hypothetical protein COT58_01440 [Candidatus Micrarchaeota archaeon CG09_land_8_20_14_0_10_60_16]PIY91632.1 MAG: hypothetical protein COY71_02155 [Candidatus Micrarchaeota archaeon CG_4_10_14_0_8_um_filter_60_7]PIZ91223.1 MAG: hypothetical protein COX86_00860 [Candidatus Micrarchaeota archaeon CG_4_10_14_0_2_um_filter_60_11]